MEVLDRIKLEENGRITLPQSVLEHYQLTTNTSIRIIETSTGILLVPLTNEPVEDELKAELDAWQAAGVASIQLFPYEESGS